MFTSSNLTSTKPITSLRYCWAAYVLLSSLALGSGYIFLQANWQPSYAFRWLVLSLFGIVYTWKVLWDGLTANHRIGETHLLPYLGPGNIMTLLRGALIALLAGFLFSPRPEGLPAWMPGVLYTLAVLADFLDGFLARASGQVTALGELLDMRFDGLGVLVATLLIVQYGQVPAWYLLVGLARYLFLAGEWFRRRLGKPIYDLPPSNSRRGMAGLQMGFIFIMLWPLFSPPGTYLVATIISVPFLIGFFRDWLFVSGVLKPGKSLVRISWGASVSRWLPLLLRITAAGLLVTQVFQEDRSFLGFSDSIVFGIAISLILGFGGRLSVIAALLFLGFLQMQADLSGLHYFLATLLTILLYLGSGALAVWKPDEFFLNHRLGRPRKEAEGPRAETKEVYVQAAE